MPYFVLALVFFFLLVPAFYLITISIQRYRKPLTRLDLSCKKCSYNLIGLPFNTKSCPECGRSITARVGTATATWRTTPWTFHPALTLGLALFLLQIAAGQLLPHDYEGDWYEVETEVFISGPSLNCLVVITTSWRETGRQWNFMNIPWLYRTRQLVKPPRISGEYHGKSGLNPTSRQLHPLFLSGPPIKSIPINTQEVAQSIPNQLNADSPQPVIDQITSDILAIYAGTPLDKLQSALGPAYNVTHQSQNSQHSISYHTMLWPIFTLHFTQITLWCIFFILCRRKYKAALASFNTPQPTAA
jgi:hypothetical protein